MSQPALAPALEPQRITKRGGRFYQVGDKEYPSATTTLGVIHKPALVPWAAGLERTHVVDIAARLYQEQHDLPRLDDKMYRQTLSSRLGTRAHRRTMKSAQQIGTEAHALIEWKNRRALGETVGPAPAVSDGAAVAVMSFEDWAKAAQLKPVAVESVVYSTHYKYAGTFDLVAEINDGALVMIDFKTGKNIYTEALLQNVMYQVAWAEMKRRPCVGGYVVRLPKTLDDDLACEVVTVPPIATLWKACEAAITLWTELHARANQ